ncbi:Uncharacterized protein BP5553_06146 [Venustampulla echinocandica]|uniref:Uncharacterized protein n=1 Tax=Venustampulla echinocandica TaxID=2656787 RepID=A0A370TMP8_9HELO|nr:Uncharacterized protein BP5553_06146 [Venustampulla echinocandica]RDL36794.1 Uncharacterized protein BP5553_06146 [Venustampulla echinocandica]
MARLVFINSTFLRRPDLPLEKQLETHDLAIPLPKCYQDSDQEVFRMLVLSPSDVQPPANPMPRIERLYHQTGGRQVGIIFLLQEKASRGGGFVAYMNLQASLFSAFEMPVIPLFLLSSLQHTLVAFSRQLVHARISPPAPHINPGTALLPYCTLNPPIPEHPRNVLSEACHSLSELSQAATTREGRAALRDLVAEPTGAIAEDIFGFWEQEFIAE